MVTVCGSLVPYSSCQATTVYVPGGRFFKSNLPSLSVTWKYGFGRTAMYAFIHGCTLHFTGMATSSRVNDFSIGAAPGGCDSFHSRLSLGIGWMLCVVWSLFTTSIFWPTCMAITCG